MWGGVVGGTQPPAGGVWGWGGMPESRIALNIPPSPGYDVPHISLCCIRSLRPYTVPFAPPPKVCRRQQLLLLSIALVTSSDPLFRAVYC